MPRIEFRANGLGNVGLASRSRYDGRNQIGPQVGLHNISQRPFRPASLDEIILGMNRQEHKLCTGSCLAELVGGLDPGQDRHGYVRHDYIGAQPHRLRNQIFPIASGSHYIKR